MAEKTEAETIKAAMSILGSRRSQKKADAARKNGSAPKLNFKGNSHQRRIQKRKTK